VLVKSIMSIIEEAVKDVAEIRKAAFSSASRELLEHFKPQLEQLIESELCGTDDDDETNEGTTTTDQRSEPTGSLTEGEGEDNILSDDSDIPQLPEGCKNTTESDTLSEGEGDDSVAERYLAIKEKDFSAIDTDSWWDIFVEAVNEYCDEHPDAVLIDLQRYFTEAKLDSYVSATPQVSENEEVVGLSESAISALSRISGGISLIESKNIQTISSKITALSETVKRILAVEKNSQGSRRFLSEVKKTLDQVEYTYSRVQESVSDSRKRDALGVKLEAMNKKLSQSQERCMKTIKENKISLELDGMPDDIDMENVSVNLITDEDDETGDDDLDLGGGDEGEEGSDDLGDMGGDEGSEEDEPTNEGEEEEEGDDLDEDEELPSDDTVVEISEDVIKSVLKKSKTDLGKSFGGGKVGKDAITESEDMDQVTEGDDEPGVKKIYKDGHLIGTLRDVDGKKEYTELMWYNGKEWVKDSGDHKWFVNDKDLEEGVGAGQDGEGDDGELHEDDDGPGGDLVPEGEDAGCGDENDHKKQDPGSVAEHVKRIANCKRIAEHATTRINQLLSIKKSTTKPSALVAVNKKLAEAKQIKTEATENAQKFTRLAESARAKSGRSGSVGQRSTSEKLLQSKLVESNLFNQKLLLAIKVKESNMTNAQKANVIARLDSARTLTETKNLFEGAMSTVSSKTPSSRSRINEGTTRAGGASSVIRSSGLSAKANVAEPKLRESAESGPVLSEGIDMARWQTLAGLV
jgi:hypothetical protein